MMIHISQHAVLRATQRLALSQDAARPWLEAAARDGVPLPSRVLSRVRGRPYPGRRKGGARFRVFGGVLLVLRGATVVTVWRLPDDQLAGLLVWSLFRVLPDFDAA